ncbi:MAG: lysylphosphatidylglycerol synthase transmembrane domain-containing protein, partial [Flavobacteriales bacterium]
GVILLYFAFRGVDLGEMVIKFKKANFFWIILSMICGLLAFFSRGIRWIYLIESMGYKAGTGNSINAVIVSYLANLAFPRIGEITRCTALNQVDEVPVSKLFGTIILERAIDMLMLLLLVTLTVLLNIEVFGGFFMDMLAQKKAQTNIPSHYLFIGLSILFGVLLVIFLFRKKITKLALINKLLLLWENVKEGLRTILNMKKNKLAFFIHTVFIWTMYYLMTYLCIFSLEATADLSMSESLFLMVAGGLGMIAPTQGGIGAYHLMIKGGLGVLGFVEEIGLLFATLVHGAQTVTILLGGSVSMLLLYLERKKKGEVLTENRVDTEKKS